MNPSRIGPWSRIVPWTGLVVAAALMAPAQASAQASAQSGTQEAEAGERLFRQRCGACHTVQAGQNRIGPSLAGLMGRKAGSVPGARYSPGLRALDVTWDVAQVEAFLADPRARVPGTTMTVAVPNAAERASIAAYLATLPGPAAEPTSLQPGSIR